MGFRRKAREQALQVLYAGEINLLPAAENLQACLASFASSPGAEEFTRRLVLGVEAHRAALDDYLKRLVDNWGLERITLVDRAILRLAAYEMLHEDDIPPAVSINEAIDIAKRFSTAQSGRFINGVLDRIRDEIESHEDH